MHEFELFIFAENSGRVDLRLLVSTRCAMRPLSLMSGCWYCADVKGSPSAKPAHALPNMVVTHYQVYMRTTGHPKGSGSGEDTPIYKYTSVHHKQYTRGGPCGQDIHDAGRCCLGEEEAKGVRVSKCRCQFTSLGRLLKEYEAPFPAEDGLRTEGPSVALSQHSSV